MIDEEIVSYIKESHFPLNNIGVYLKNVGDVWSMCLGDEDELIIEDPKEGIILKEGVEYNRALVTPEVLDIAKSMIKEEG